MIRSFELLGCGFRCRSGSGGSLLGNKCSWLADVRDHDISCVGGLDTLRKFNLSDVKRLAFLKESDVFFNRIRKIVGKANDFQSVCVLLKNSTCLYALCLTDKVDRDVRSDLCLIVHSEEIHVKRMSGKRIVLDRLEENGTAAFALNIEVN